ncbi:TDP-N-acetylfucosamine:lipid II N-acetylfucosaminyltransferase [Culturomica massiliensis]|jgi:dTDP-N-acetylfucosamine:lipid II N-acetylfucosaminyltransferase|uniref:TDP-N-acetylfucosamine:lipid II N-acetylfucosaminyltransferase n=1 Tax=Culturomica massiliensis TaxID=1841857 RepID=UPI000E559A11|nr:MULTISPECIES: TDP-N-acetylfucosamine:lipid II N-acetylfucosaminyltransferase [Odoribacteraceae]RHV92932.1 hypothetical protein DXA95_11595 [Odoribacter sp. OF09-27XD]
MIYHVFKGYIYHLSPSIINSILNHAGETSKNGIKDHFFYISFTQSKTALKTPNEAVFKEIFSKYQFNNYKFITEKTDLLKIINKKNKKNDSYIFHNSCVPYRYQLLFYFKIWFYRIPRATLVCWGECDFIISSFFKKHLWLFRLLFGWLFRSLAYIITLSQADYESCKKIHRKTNVLFLEYFNDTVTALRTNHLKKAPYITIMISHSGWEHNRHHESFEKILKFKDEDIRIICPLCYGNQEYIESVISKGKQMFGDKFTYFTELKPREEYIQLIRTIDVYITSAANQTGLFAAYTSVLSGAKVYATGNILSSFRSYGINIQDINDLTAEQFDLFKEKVSDNVYQKNIQAYEKLKNTDFKTKQWQIIFNH